MKYEICGSGVYGVLLAAQLEKISKYSSKKIRISLIDKADQILANWQYSNIGNYKISGGFHGIEMPRASFCYSILKDLTGEEIFEKIPNYKLLFINDEIIEFSSSLNNWPSSISSGLSDALRNKKEFRNKLEFMNYIIENTKLGKIIKNCQIRYSDDIQESWFSFYPWFFPSDFSFNLSDEGQAFQEKVRKGFVKPYYLQPKSSHFGQLIPLVEKSLKKRDIEIHKNQSIEINEDLNLVNKKDDTQVIWSSSSVNLLKIKKSNIFQKLTNTKRYLHLILLKVNLDLFNKWLSNFSEKPSEILCIIEESIGISRISFPNQDHLEGKPTNDQLILIEYIAEVDNLETKVLDKVIEVLSRTFKFGRSLELIDKKLLRALFINSPDTYEMASKEIRKLLMNSNLKVPFIYLWPVNMAKCGFAAEKASEELFSKFTNK
tara:strand:- start:6509 stop:7807 length:1299 start_codon:yes stop_codon:yes gene_type:complete